MNLSNDNKREEKQWRVLVHETKIKELFWFDEISSTNDLAKNFLLQNAESFVFDAPLLFVAAKQTAGQGRGAHSWWSPEGGLFLTFIASRHDFGLDDDDSVELSIQVAQGVARTVSAALSKRERNGKRLISVKVKHPNDVLLNGKKIAGILIKSPTPERVLIGIGVNLNNSVATAPDEIKERLVSLIDIDGVSIDPIEFTRILIGELFD